MLYDPIYDVMNIVVQVDSFFTEAEIEECCRGTSVWICPVCHKSLSRKQTLKAHLNSVHSVRAGTASKRYKLYDYCPTARIPRSTQSRW
ncbi:uncharacterized protein LOC124275101 [Haliotis rubra]|uniref:uncharacterized protein LOC124275101 n=1 Tax=Haliotis rubra TaxID=36100 RepID=UPI001EE630C6|nr:uncharacterized protein LOC124275101 [Haliotis rubra]